MLRSLRYQIQFWLGVVYKVIIAGVFVGQAGFFIWIGIQLAESPVYKGAIAASKAKDNLVSEVQKFNPFKSIHKQE